MKNLGTLMMAFILFVGLAACGMTAETTTAAIETIDTESIANETVANETVANETVANETVANETVANETVVAETLPEITLDMLRLSEHSEDIQEHCNPMYCHWDCEEHCDERCILHAPAYVGIPVHAPNGFIYVVARFTPEEREAVGSFDLSKTFKMVVTPDTQFKSAGVQYWRNLNGELDPEMESDYPLTEEEMGELCAAIPISTDRMGLEFIIDPSTGDFLAVVPNELEVVPNWWK